MVSLYMDENVKGAITREVRRRGADVLTVQEDGREGLDDPDVLDRATALGRVLFSQDEDLLAEATRRLRAGSPFGGVIYAHQQRVPIGPCVEFLELVAAAGELEEFANGVTWVPHHQP
jgi:hypothetical protein